MEEFGKRLSLNEASELRADLEKRGLRPLAAVVSAWIKQVRSGEQGWSAKVQKKLSEAGNHQKIADKIAALDAQLSTLDEGVDVESIDSAIGELVLLLADDSMPATIRNPVRDVIEGNEVGRDRGTRTLPQTVGWREKFTPRRGDQRLFHQFRQLCVLEEPIEHEERTHAVDAPPNESINQVSDGPERTSDGERIHAELLRAISLGIYPPLLVAFVKLWPQIADRIQKQSDLKASDFATSRAKLKELSGKLSELRLKSLDKETWQDLEKTERAIASRLSKDFREVNDVKFNAARRISSPRGQEPSSSIVGVTTGMIAPERELPDRQLFINRCAFTLRVIDLFNATLAEIEEELSRSEKGDDEPQQGGVLLDEDQQHWEGGPLSRDATAELQPPAGRPEFQDAERVAPGEEQVFAGDAPPIAVEPAPSTSEGTEPVESKTDAAGPEQETTTHPVSEFDQNQELWHSEKRGDEPQGGGVLLDEDQQRREEGPPSPDAAVELQPSTARQEFQEATSPAPSEVSVAEDQQSPPTEAQIRRLTPQYAAENYSFETFRHMTEVGQQAGILKVREDITQGEPELTVENINRYFSRMVGKELGDDYKYHLCHLVQEFRKTNAVNLMYTSPNGELITVTLSPHRRPDRNQVRFRLFTAEKKQRLIASPPELPTGLFLKSPNELQAIDECNRQINAEL